jgi:hypothetical protein
MGVEWLGRRERWCTSFSSILATAREMMEAGSLKVDINQREKKKRNV